jgi:RNA polymerase sigma-70 factor (ECF subfamily)
MTEWSGSTDAELIALLREGDRNAYAEIYDRYNGILYLFAYKRFRTGKKHGT